MYRIFRARVPAAVMWRRSVPFLLIIAGSTLGALAAGLFLSSHSSSAVFSSVRAFSDPVFFSRVLILSALFSLLLLAAGFSQQNAVLGLLLFLRGFSAGYVLWLAGALQRNDGQLFSRKLLLLFNVLPLPACLLTADYFLHPELRTARCSLSVLIALHCASIALALLLRELLH